MLFVAVARSYSDDSTIRYVVPVLWMTSRLPIMANRVYAQNNITGAAPRAKCDSTIALFFELYLK